MTDKPTFDNNIYALNSICIRAQSSVMSLLTQHFRGARSGYPDVLGFRCCCGDIVPEPAGDTRHKERRVDRRHPGSPFQSGLLAANAARRQAGQAESDRVVMAA